MGRIIQLPVVVGDVLQQDDEDAQAFISAANITDENIKKGINDFVNNLKDLSLWDLFYSIYPFLGDNKGYSYNLKDVSKHKISFSSQVEYLSGGVRFNTGTGNMIFSGSNMESQNISLHLYIQNDIINGALDVGQWTDTNTNRLAMHVNLSSGSYFDISSTSYRATYKLSEATGLISGNRLSGTQGIYRNGELKHSVNNNNSVSPASVVLNSGGLINTRIFSFAAVGKGFTTAQMYILYGLIQLFLTKMGRAI